VNARSIMGSRMLDEICHNPNVCFGGRWAMEPDPGFRIGDVEDDGGRALHARLLRGDDPTASSDLANLCLAPLVHWLQGRYPREDQALLETVAIELILKVGREPEQYDPDRGTLPAYLRMAVRRDVQNALQRERRRAARQTPLGIVELRPPARNSGWTRSSDPVAMMLEADGEARVTVLLEQFTGREREVVEMIVEGERSTERYAALLGIQDRPLDEQRREVKRVKDKLKGRLKRLGRKEYGDG
jgi:RNA polymerase sigma-70 factor, ECF subfamily